jgi:hypothetical protein
MFVLLLELCATNNFGAKTEKPVSTFLICFYFFANVLCIEVKVSATPVHAQSHAHKVWM